MLGKIKQSKAIIRQVLKDNYLILAFCSSILMFIILYFLTLATTTDQSLGIFIMMNGFLYTVSTFFLLAVISVLIGVYVSLLVYKSKLKYKKANIRIRAGGALGVTTGLFSAGCPMCGAFLFGLIGFPLTLFFLPFKGIELRITAIIILMISIYFISRSLIECKTPKIKNEIFK